MNRRPFLVIALGTLVLATLTGESRGGQSGDTRPEPLAIVNEDTLTTLDLELEIGVMLRRKAPEGPLILPEGDKILRRLIQNEMFIQEGYRQQLDQQFIVTNRVKESVRSQCVSALLDSVARSVDKETPDLYNARKTEVSNYLVELMDKHHVQVDSTLLASLDFGSNDQEVINAIRDSQGILAKLPSGNLVVSSFYQVVMFEAFHGLQGKPDAADRRDSIFQNWLFESLLTYEIRAMGMPQQPKYVALATKIERTLVGEEALNILMNSPYQPTDDEIEAFYKDNLDLVTPPPMVKLKSVMLNGKEPADLFRSRLQKGAKFNWLVDNTAEVVEGTRPFAEEWQAPDKVGIEPDDAYVGFVPEPLEFPGGGWVVAMVAEVSLQDPLPMESCRKFLVANLIKAHREDLMAEIVQRLEEVTVIQVLPGAVEQVDRIIAEALEVANAPVDPPVEDSPTPEPTESAEKQD